ncbi:MAG TPA: universal stress protein [Mycobacteriales bacterium]|nr:universal stress protein [Mycobacteriales bacterium]
MTAAPVVVGHDGSPPADAALRWGLGTAVARGSGIVVVRACDEHDLDRAQAELTEAVRGLEARSGDVEISCRAVAGRPVPVLAEASGEAALLVVGRKGRGLVLQRLGSTASGVLRSARCPVAVVPDPARTGDRVVVGWDGSPASADAVAWAAEHAALSQRPLEVLVAWQITTLAGQVQHEPGIAPPITAYEQLAEAEAEAGAALAREVAGEALPTVTSRAVHRPATAALMDAADDAALLVVGSRGRGGFAGLVLGSTSEQVSRHAPCPVVVVRRAGDPAEDGEPG